MELFSSLSGQPNIERLYEKNDIEGLIKALEYYRGWEIRENAAKALGDLGNPQAVEALIHTLSDPFEMVRESAAYALGNMDYEIVIDPLINALKRDDKYLRQGAAKALGNMKAKESVNSLIYALNDKYCEVQISAAESLGKIGAIEAIGPLGELLNTEPCTKKGIYVKEVVVEALGNIRNKKAVEPLVDAMKISCPDPTVHLDEETSWDNAVDLRDKASASLLKIGDKSAVEPIIENLKSENVWIRESAVVFLGNMGDKRALNPLSNLLEDDDEEIRKIAAEAIEIIKNQNPL